MELEEKMKKGIESTIIELDVDWSCVIGLDDVKKVVQVLLTACGIPSSLALMCMFTLS